MEEELIELGSPTASKRVIPLHGLTGTASVIRPVAEYLCKRLGEDYSFLLPTAPIIKVKQFSGEPAHAWFDLTSSLPSINEEDSYRFSDSRSLMSKLPRRVSASAGLPKGVQLGFCTFSKRSFTCSDTTVYSFRSHISPQTSLRDSPPLDLKR